MRGESPPPWSGPLFGGGMVDLDDLKGRPVLILIWADWCPPCIDVSLPRLQETFAQRGDRISVLATASASSSAESSEAIVQRGGFTFPVAIDEADDVPERWGLLAIPVWVLLDADGRVIDGQIGVIDDLNGPLAKAGQ